jgi:monoamine oxidase
MAGALTDAQLIDDLAEAFGVESAAERQEPTVFRWAEQPHIRGCEEIFAPGELTEMGPRLITPHGLVGFAGVARSSWPDNMEGAVQSGERAADEALVAL